jgi:hypothetical protein
MNVHPVGWKFDWAAIAITALEQCEQCGLLRNSYTLPLLDARQVIETDSQPSRFDQVFFASSPNESGC